MPVKTQAKLHDESNGFWSFMETVAQISATLLLGLLASPEKVGRRIVIGDGDEDTISFYYEKSPDRIFLWNKSTEVCCASFTRMPDDAEATVEFVVVGPGEKSDDLSALFHKYREGACDIVTYPEEGDKQVGGKDQLPPHFRFTLALLNSGRRIAIGGGILFVTYQLGRLAIDNRTPFAFHMNSFFVGGDFSVTLNTYVPPNRETEAATPRPPINGPISSAMNFDKV
jgi:hypothetical protein